MTDFYASYLFLIIAIVLLIIGLYFKVLWIFFGSAISWFVAGAYFITNAGVDTFITGLGWFCIAAGIASAFTPIALRQKKQDEIIPTKSRVDYLAEHRNKIKAIRDSRIKRIEDD